MSSLEVQKTDLECQQSESDKTKPSVEEQETAVESILSQCEELVLNLEELFTSITEDKRKVDEFEEKLHICHKKFVDYYIKEMLCKNKMSLKSQELMRMQRFLDASESRSALFHILSEQQNQGKFKGVIGRLGDLGTIDEHYNVAISAACNYLDHIVVESEDIAEEFSEFLKTKTELSPNFISLDKMEEWVPYTTQKITTEQGWIR